ESEDFDFNPVGIDLSEQVVVRRRRRFLGMTAGQRAFLSIMLFFNVLIIGLGLLIVTNRIDLGFLSQIIPQ
ncbi:MAG: hypothetical protein KC708_24875, partial [Anaerolineae bacterium]|nr:hypothetical protein [Anaerolineae bacterium]